MIQHGDPLKAAAVAGYGNPDAAASKNKRKPALMAAVLEAERQRLAETLLPLANELVEHVLRDGKETTRNRLTAAKMVYDRSSALLTDAQAEGREAHEMTAHELREAIAKRRAALDALDGQVHDLAASEARDVTPDPAPGEGGALG
jgi:hypothetical protein